MVSVASAYWPARVRRPPRERTMTPEPATIVVVPMPYWRMEMAVPMANPTKELGGTVRVFAEAELVSTSFPASARTNV